MAERTKKTRQERAYESLRADILASRLAPGQKLPFADLVKDYSVSIGVIREALSRLVEQGLVRSSPQQGFSVSPISVEDLAQLTEARREIETLTLRHAIAEGDVLWESEVLASHHRLANCPIGAPGDPDRLSEEWVEAHRVFHETLLAGCRNTRLTGIANQLRAAAELYRRWSVPLSHGQRDIAAEHQGLLDAVLKRDSELAVARLDAHISLTTKLIVEPLKGSTEQGLKRPSLIASSDSAS